MSLYSRMAEYKSARYVTQSNSTAFDVRYAPGTKVGNAGIYRCNGCGDEVCVPHGHSLPQPAQHPHDAAAGKAEWQLLVFAERLK
ncbi:MAG TPA: hypothetical protein VE010_23300 [Thermoanaerobaculia bacterium]|nr:hypothetical protein [Thermoanaerobaculia bacterium]